MNALASSGTAVSDQWSVLASAGDEMQSVSQIATKSLKKAMKQLSVALLDIKVQKAQAELKQTRQDHSEKVQFLNQSLQQAKEKHDEDVKALKKELNQENVDQKAEFDERLKKIDANLT